jgi:putative ABC transport system ATP-binding protein
MTTVVQLDGAARRFGSGHTEVTALHPTSLSVEAGELLAVMGPSGSGKTTLLSLVGGLDRPSEGRVIVAGRDVGSLRPKDLAILRRRTVGYVFQDLNLLQGLTARENVAIPLELDGRPIGEARADADAALDSVGLANLANRFPDDLSGGEQQRVAIARARGWPPDPARRRADRRPRLDHRGVGHAPPARPLRRRRHGDPRDSRRCARGLG